MSLTKGEDKMKKTSITIAILLLVLTLSLTGLTGCSSDQEQDAGVTKKKINIATATTGGGFYPIGIAMAQLFNENIPEINASTSTSAGSVENISLLQNGEAQLAFSQSNVALWAFEGSDSFSGNAFSELRLVLPVLCSPHQIVMRKNADINSIADLKGKRFVVGRPGSGNETTALAILDGIGLTSSDIKAEYLGQSEALDAIKNGQVDAALVVGGVPISSITDYLMTPGSDGAILGFSDSEIKALTQKHPWMQPMKITAGTYPGINEDLKMTGNISYLVSTEKLLDEETVYKMLKVIYENEEWLKQNNDSLRNEAFEEPWNFIDLPVPLHSGTEKFLKEVALGQKS